MTKISDDHLEVSFEGRTTGRDARVKTMNFFFFTSRTIESHTVPKLDTTDHVE